MKRWLFRSACLLGVCLLMLDIHSTGRAQSFTAVMYLPTIRYPDPCATTSIPVIAQPPTPARFAFYHFDYLSADTGDLYITNADNTGRTRLTNDGAIESRPTWSPDGKQIAYVRAGYTETSLRLLRLSDRHVTTIHTWTNDITVGDPAWSPDGKQIAFSVGPYPQLNIAVIQTNGTELRNLTSTGTNQDPSWSPDGSRIVFSSAHGDVSHLYVMQADGTQQIQLTNQQVSDSQPAWSPDGTRIAFTSGCIGGLAFNDSIFIIQADGSGRMHMPVQEGFSSGVLDSQTQPTWSPDSRRIAYTQSFYKGTDIFIVNLDGSGISQVGLSLDSAPSWAPR